MTHLVLLGHAPSIHLRRWATAMHERGFRVSVLSEAAQAIDGVAVQVLPPLGAAGWFGRVPALRRALRQLQPDIVHAHYITSYGMLGAVSTLGGHHPLVLTAWGSDILVTPHHSRALRWLTGWALRRAALITADSRDVLDQIRSYRPRAELAEVFWGADTKAFRPGTPAAGFHIASLRAWEPNYRIDTLLHALALLRASGPATLHLFGGGSGAAALRALVAELGLADAVVWHGLVPPQQLAAALAGCHVSVSIPASDATSVSLLESMACALPVVVSDLPANRQWVSGEGGHVVDGNDPAAVAQALQTLRADPAGGARMGAHNRAVIVAQGSSASQMDRMAALYRQLRA
jgi:glycosyltransferase involved in cell wall biosynthesis